MQGLRIACRNLQKECRALRPKSIAHFYQELPALQKIVSTLPKSMAVDFNLPFELYDTSINTTDDFNRRVESYDTFINTKYELNGIPTNAQLGESDYKLHVSLSPESYRQHREAIKEILDQALRDDVIGHYKFTIEEKLDVNSPTDKRLFDGDQFTLYIPSSYSETQILSLCEKINNKLYELNATAGKFAASESALTPFISFRQDTFEGKYYRATDTTMKLTQERAPLFIALKKGFNQLWAVEEILPKQLPTQAQINQDPQLFLSDHRPIPAIVPLKNKSEPLRLISWNIYGGGPCGYGLNEIHSKLPGMKENIEQCNSINRQMQDADTAKKKDLKNDLKRLQNEQATMIAEYDTDRFQRQAGLLKQSNVDVVLIQEATPESYQIFNKVLAPEWATIPMRENGTVMSFYRVDRYLLVDDSIQYPECNDSIKDSQSFTLISQKNAEEPPLHITNLWGQFHFDEDDTFNQRAKNIDTLLSQPRKDGGVNIVGGDLNIAVGLCTNDPTTVTSRGLNSSDNHVNNGCIDAVMYKRSDGNFTLCQSETVQYIRSQSEQQKTNIYIPGDLKIRADMLKKITDQIEHIQASNKYFLKGSWFLRQGTEKIAALNELEKRIIESPQGSAYKDIIDEWQEAGPDDKTTTYRAIIHKHRLGREEHSNLTDTEKTIEDIKTIISRPR